MTLARALAAEAIGTFALVFAGAGAVMVDAKTHQLGHVGVAITFGLVIMVMIYAVGHVSGAHFNAAIQGTGPAPVFTVDPEQLHEGKQLAEAFTSIPGTVWRRWTSDGH